MNVRILLAIAAPILVLGGGAAASYYLSQRRPPAERSAPEPVPPLVEVVRPLQESLVFDVTTYGEVRPRTELDLVAEIGGRVTWTAPELVDGGFFEEDAPLVRIDPRDFELALARTELDLARAERRLAEEQAAADVATREWERLGRGEGTPLALRQPQLAEARAEVAAAEAELELRRRDLERTEMRAPFVGRVHSADVETGTFVTRGQALARIWAVDHAEVRLPLPDEQLAFLSPSLSRALLEPANGDAPPPTDVEVTLSTRFAGREHSWTGRIVRTESALDPRTRMVVLVARVDDPYGLITRSPRPPLSVGMFVEARIGGRTIDGVLSLPREALRGASRVWVMDDEDRLRFREVEVLRASSARVVIGNGLFPGERVVVSPLELATDGRLVRVVETEPVR